MSTALTADTRNDVVLWLDGKGYAGWTDVSINRGIDAVCGSFELGITIREKTGGAVFPVKTGMTCKVTLGGVSQVTGCIDSVNRSLSAEDWKIKIAGRDKAADLADCSAVNSPGSWSNAKLETIARAIAAPFGISIDVASSTGAAFRKFALQQGETAWAAIERMARYRGLIAWSLGDGTIRIGNPDSGLITGQVIEGVNLLSAEVTDDASQRFSQYIVKGQAAADDNRHGKAVAQVKAEASDADVSRYRPLIIVAEEQTDVSSARKRAAWEAQTRAAKAQPVTARVPVWYAGDRGTGPAWEPGARAQVRIPRCDVDGVHLIERINLVRNSEEGTYTSLSLVPPGAWAQLAEPEAKA